MTSTEKAETVERLSTRYTHVGALLVRDDESLCRLLTNLDFSARDLEIGGYLASFLV